jgi:hypothetical protein
MPSKSGKTRQQQRNKATTITHGVVNFSETGRVPNNVSVWDLWEHIFGGGTMPPGTTIADIQRKLGTGENPDPDPNHMGDDDDPEPKGYDPNEERDAEWGSEKRRAHLARVEKHDEARVKAQGIIMMRIAIVFASLNYRKLSFLKSEHHERHRIVTGLMTRISALKGYTCVSAAHAHLEGINANWRWTQAREDFLGNPPNAFGEDLFTRSNFWEYVGVIVNGCIKHRRKFDTVIIDHYYNLPDSLKYQNRSILSITRVDSPGHIALPVRERIEAASRTKIAGVCSKCAMSSACHRHVPSKLGNATVHTCPVCSMTSTCHSYSVLL